MWPLYHFPATRTLLKPVHPEADCPRASCSLDVPRQIEAAAGVETGHDELVLAGSVCRNLTSSMSRLMLRHIDPRQTRTRGVLDLHRQAPFASTLGVCISAVHRGSTRLRGLG